MTGEDADAILVALGSNMGVFGLEPAAVIRRALDEFPERGLEVKAKSRLWRSAAWPDATAPGFFNAVAMVETALGPEALMTRLLEIEAAFGRVRDCPNAPRTLDLDLIAYGRLCLSDEGLILPHPRAAERRFVMAPLAELLPGWRHPAGGERAEDLARTAGVGVDAYPG